MFWLYNLAYFLFNDLFHGIILPLFIISIPSRPDNTCNDKKSFYISRTTSALEPRRPRASESLCFDTGSTYFDTRAFNGQTSTQENNEQAFEVQKFCKAIAPFQLVPSPQPDSVFLSSSETIRPLDPKDIQRMIKKILR